MLKKIMKLLFQLITLLLLTSCSLFKGQEEQIESISLSRSGCYGKCPVYQVTFNRDGSILYKGDMFVEHIGTYNVSTDFDFQSLEDLVNTSDFFNLEDRYIENVTDVPVCGVTVRTTLKTKSVVDNGIGPQKLRYFQKEIDKVLSSSENAVWKKVE